MFNAVLTERLMRIQKAARRKIMRRWELHGTRVSCNLACLKQWYSLTLQWMKLKMCWAIPSFGNIQYFLLVHGAEHLEGGCPLAEPFCQKIFEMSLWACMLGREKDFCISALWGCMGSRSHGWEWQKEKWKWRPGWWSHPGENGCWFMAAAFSHHYPCLASPLLRALRKGTGQGSLQNLHFYMAYGKSPEVPMPAPKAATIFTEGSDESIKQKV